MVPASFGGKVGVLGLGREGTALTRWLLRHDVKPTVVDRRPADTFGGLHQELTEAGVKWRLGPGYLENLTDFGTLFRSPGIPFLTAEIQQAREQGTDVTSQTKLFFDRNPATVVGISGTKGKGTTAKMLESMLRLAGRPVYVGGNIGTPPVEFLDDLSKDDIVILELSSFQLQDLDQSPPIAIITNVTADHLDHHRNLAEYRQAKSSLIRFQGPSDTAILNADDDGSKELAGTAGGGVRWFSHRREVFPGAYIRDDRLTLHLEEKQTESLIEVEALAVPGWHTVDDALAASLAAELLGVRPGQITRALRDFKGLRHHMEAVAVKNEVTYVNDSYATNPTATIAAIQSYDQPLVLILGGSDKGLDYRPLAETIVSRDVKAVVLVGDLAPSLEEALKEAAAQGGRLPELKSVNQRENIVPAAESLASKGDVVLLSPASASFGMFRDYRERGEYFTEQVLRS